MSQTIGSVTPAGDVETASVDGGNNPRHSPVFDTLVSAGGQIGYARVSRPDQLIDRQLDALHQAGCDRVFSDHGLSGTQATRPGLSACLDYLRSGDTLVIASLDRLGRRTAQLLALIDDLREREVSLRILNLGLDSRTPSGQVVLTIMAALSEMEREVLAERTRQGLAAARARGRVGGRPRALTAEQVEVARGWRQEDRSWADIARLLGVSERTVRRRI